MSEISMIGNIDGFYVAAEIRFIRQVHKGAILIVEGGDDAKVFEKFVDSNACAIQIGLGKKNVLEALDILEDADFPGILGIADADFDRITKKTYPTENLCITDAHDMDLTIFCSSALNRYMREYSDQDLFKKVFDLDVSRLRDYLVESCLPLAYCRFVSDNYNLNL